MSSILRIVLSAALGLCSLASLGTGQVAHDAGAACQPTWIPAFGAMPGTQNAVYALAVFDDGTGPALYAGGAFTGAGGVAAGFIAKWDGTSWSAVGGGTDGPVQALTVFDAGSGPALYAGGGFLTAGGVAVDFIAKWDGTSWSALGSGMGGGAVLALAAFDDGSGPALYAGGSFTSADGVPASRIAKWDGATWSGVAHGMSALFASSVKALTVFDDGAGPALYAGGSFSSAGGVAANGIAKWDGTSWSALGSGVFGIVHALKVFDDGSGPALGVGGHFTSTVDARNIAKWDGTGWSALGSGTQGEVYALAECDTGGGLALQAGGLFASAGGVAVNNAAQWDGTSWSALGGGLNDTVFALTAVDEGSGSTLYAGGNFMNAGGVAASHIAKWNAAHWSAMGESGMDNGVNALAAFDDGHGPALYAGGGFTSAGGAAANHIAKWDGTSWSAFGSGIDGTVIALREFDDGGGLALYAGGAFTSAGGVAANFIAKWDGMSWSGLGSGMNGYVQSLTVFDDGSGPALYAGGAFTSAGGVAANYIAKWDGMSWSAVGSGVGGTSPAVLALTVFDDGSGPALYVGGGFTLAGGVAANDIAKWDGTSWSALGSGVSGLGSSIHALTVFDDGSGDALYAGGTFPSAGGVTGTKNIARWDGSSWSALGGGTSGHVEVLTVSEDGSGPALYAGGLFESAGGVAASNIAKWDGTRWSALGEGMTFDVAALTGLDDGSGPALYAGGYFSFSPAGDSFLAKWGCPAISSLSGCAGNPATLAALASSAPLGAPLPLRITGFAAVDGVGVVAHGASGLDASGCGLLVPGLGELLLAPAPKTLLSGPLSGGICDLSPLVPGIASLSGVVTHVQAAAVDVSLPQPIELTNALAVKLGP